MFFVSVASKEFSRAVSLLFATLAARYITVAGKRLRRIERARGIRPPVLFLKRYDSKGASG